MRSRVLAVAAGVLLVAITATTALAGHQTSGVKSYTGCLVPNDGVLIKIKEGNAPKSACTGGQVEAHFSGGDITKISVGAGLSTVPADGANGEVRIVLDASHALPQGCADGRVAEWDSGTDRWICGVDDDTTYTAGTGLDLVGANDTEFEIESAYRLPGKACSTAGEFARGFNANGVIQCAAPSPTGLVVWEKRGSASAALPKGEGVDLVIMPLPAGTYLVTAVATLNDGGGTVGGDEEVSVQCRLRDGAFASLPAMSALVDIGENTGNDGPAASGVIHGVLTLASPDSVRFTCTSSGGDGDPDSAFSSNMTAIEVGTVHRP